MEEHILKQFKVHVRRKEEVDDTIRYTSLVSLDVSRLIGLAIVLWCTERR